MVKVSVQHPPIPASGFTDNQGFLTLEAQYFLLDLWNRTGGNDDFIDELLGRTRHIAIAVTGTVTMSSETDSGGEGVEERYYFLEFTGTPGVATDVNFSDIEGNYFVWNNTDSVLTFKTATDTTGKAVPVGRFDIIAIESTDFSVRNLMHVTQASLLGATAAGPVAEVTLNSTLEFNAGALRRAALTGEVTATAGSNATVVNPGGLVTPAVDDKVLIQDTDDADSLQYITVSSLAGALDHGTLLGLADDDHQQYILADGTRALTAAWDAGSWQIRAETFQSDITTGTAPLVVASTTVVTNLNADLLDGQEGTYYLDSANFTGTNWVDLTDGGATTLHKHDHGGMDGLADDDHTQYALLNGRAAGQTLIGGTAAGDDIHLQTTSDVSKGTYFLDELTTNGFVITSGGTGALSIDATSYQPLDAELTALAGLTSAADALPYFTGSGTAATTTLTAFARTILDDADEATFKATVNLEIGTDVQAWGDVLDDLNTLGAASADGEFIVATGAGVFAYESGSTARASLDVLSTAQIAARVSLGL